ncbi:MAG: hypothetical protein V3R94_09390 [Acidobacteriota bacterium]
MDPTQIIITRVLQEIQEGHALVLGKGIPQLLKPHLMESVQLTELHPGAGEQTVDLVVVEADEISQDGSLALVDDEGMGDLKADHWIVATLHSRDSGEAKIVQTGNLPTTPEVMAQTVITELGVLRINEVGLVLTEIAPGISTDDVKSQTAASLHVADNIKVMEL